MSITEDNIRKLILNIDFKSEQWSVNQIKEAIRSVTGEVPGIKINYNKDVLINELKGEATEYKKLESIEIIFTDLDDKIKKVQYLID